MIAGKQIFLPIMIFLKGIFIYRAAGSDFELELIPKNKLTKQQVNEIKKSVWDEFGTEDTDDF